MISFFPNTIRQAGGGIDRPFYDDADIIFSHMKMRSTYTGFWARVERDSDNATLDVGFLPNRLPDLAAANDFRTSGTLSIKWIYNQGNLVGSDPDNAAKNGGRVTQNFNAVIHDGTEWVRIGDWLACDNNVLAPIDNRVAMYLFDYESPSILDKDSMAFSVFQNDNGTTFKFKFGDCKNTNTNTYIINAHDNRTTGKVFIQYRPNGTIVSALDNIDPIAAHEQITYTRNGNTIEGRRNGTLVNSASTATVFSAENNYKIGIYGVIWGATNSDDYNNKSKGKFQELIIYKSFDETKRNSIESEQTSFYGTS